jgi:hypothetical protein
VYKVTGAERLVSSSGIARLIQPESERHPAVALLMVSRQSLWVPKQD